MKNALKCTLLLLITVLVYNCSSGDDSEDNCTKTIVIPQIYFVNNQSYNFDTTQEVPCDFPDPETPEIIEPPVLENFSYEVLNFTFTPDTGNNTNRLQFEIKLNNPNVTAVEGVPILTLISDGLEFSGSYSNNAIVPCYGIEANSSCVLTFDQESSLDLGLVNSIELIDVTYYLTN